MRAAARAIVMEFSTSRGELRASNKAALTILGDGSNPFLTWRSREGGWRTNLESAISDVLEVRITVVWI
jgi:hypothetical protein